MGQIRKWYEGKLTPYENDPGSSVVFFGWNCERHWTSKLAHIVVAFYLREWKWVIGTAIALVGVWVAIGRVG